MYFQNRIDAGQKLANELEDTQIDWSGYQVIGLANGGVPVAAEVANRLHRPLSALSVDDAEIEGVGKAIVTSLGSGRLKINADPPRWETIACDQAFNHVIRDLYAAARRRDSLANNIQVLPIGQKVIIIDDGLVSGDTALTAIEAVRRRGATDIVLAIPAVPPWIMAVQDGFRVITWRVSGLNHFTTGICYYSFEPVSDDEVRRLVRETNNQNTVAA